PLRKNNQTKQKKGSSSFVSFVVTTILVEKTYDSKGKHTFGFVCTFFNTHQIHIKHDCGQYDRQPARQIHVAKTVSGTHRSPKERAGADAQIVTCKERGKSLAAPVYPRLLHDNRLKSGQNGAVP